MKNLISANSGGGATEAVANLQRRRDVGIPQHQIDGFWAAVSIYMLRDARTSPLLRHRHRSNKFLILEAEQDAEA